MCGIAGWVDWERDLSQERATMASMARTLACRGPDEEGAWSDREVAFVHRRLAVIDLEGGKQPMRTAFDDGRPCVLTYAGEIYNFVELRRELEGLGHAFRTRSDTEVLLRAYVEWGPACVGRLNGMFAFGIWDGRRRELFLARDRLGVKPLFYALRGRGLLFGSEPKALLAHPLVEPEVDDDGLAEVLAIGIARTPGHGVYRGVHELRPGFTLRFTRDGAEVERYWQLQSRPHTDDLATTAATVRSLLEDIVRRQLVSDVPICMLLSGGLDSSAVTALAARAVAEARTRGHAAGAVPSAIDTYSVDFARSAEHFRPNELHTGLDAPFVKLVVEAVRSRHHEIVVDTADIIDRFFEPLVARDLPSLGEIDVSLYLLFREIRRHATVAVSGESADEVFGGYPWFHSEEALAADRFPWTLEQPDGTGWLSADAARRLRPAERSAARYREALAEVPALAGEPPREARMREIFYLNLTRFLLALLDRKDRMSMAVGLEVRVPFCDHRLVEYVWNVPWTMKSHGGREKGLLRLAMEGLLPREVLDRKKSAYPSTQDPAYAAAVRRMLDAVLDDARSPLLPLVDAPKLRAALAGEGDADGVGLRGRAHAFAYLVQVNEWLRRYRVRLV